jgi:hypothetical protein
MQKSFRVSYRTLQRLARASAEFELAAQRLQLEKDAVAAALDLPGPITHIDLVQGLLLVEVDEQVVPKLKLEE